MSNSQANPATPSAEKILLVDDDRLNRRILSSILKPEGYTIAEAETGEDALNQYGTFQPDLVLLDVMLPGINGFETCRRIKHDFPGSHDVPVVFITAKNESDDVVEGLAAGGVDYLPKPFRPREAVARIKTHLHNRHLILHQRSLVDQLSNANATKNRLLGMAAHDLRNPLVSIRGLAEFLQEGAVGPITAEQKELVETIHSASQQMLELLNELLDLSVIESGELKMRREPENLAELVQKAVHLNTINATKKQMKIELVPGKLPATIDIDSQKIKQVIDNLLSNAIKYSPPGSIITVETASNEEMCRLSVKDQGPGIPKDEHHRLFKDFGQLSSKPTGGEKSTGLGLAICRKIVEAHGGSITAENLPEKGCVFRVILPIF